LAQMIDERLNQLT